MARERDFPASRRPGLESATTWVFGMLGLGILAALLVVAVAPPAGDETNGPTTSSRAGSTQHAAARADGIATGVALRIASRAHQSGC